jgi:hypothetical protein
MYAEKASSIKKSKTYERAKIITCARDFIFFFYNGQLLVLGLTEILYNSLLYKCI